MLYVGVRLKYKNLWSNPSMLTANYDAIHCLSEEVVSLENMSRTSNQSVNDLCRERERSRIPSATFRRNYILANQVSADEVLSVVTRDQVSTDRDMGITRAGKRRKQLVRQQATTEDNEEELGITLQDSQVQSSSSTENKIAGTVEISLSPGSKQGLGCLETVGVDSVCSDKKPLDEPISLPESRASSNRIYYSERIDISPCSISSGDGVTGFRHKHREEAGVDKIRKQKTIESAPSRYGSARYLPKQYSATSSYSALLSIHPSPSSNFGSTTPKLTLVRGQSCSLVDIPTYLGSAVELANFTGVKEVETLVVPTQNRMSQVSRENIRKLKHELLKHRRKEKPTRRTECTLICIALAFLLVCITLVGTMLSYTTQYQDKAVADNMFYNDLLTTPYYHNKSQLEA